MASNSSLSKDIPTQIYAFTNENLTSFESIYHFDGADVLCVLGSGDQYFASKLYGAKNVEVFDYNPSTWPYFALKFHAIKILSYEEFLRLFLDSRLTDWNLLNKVIPYLPYEILTDLKKMLMRDKSSPKFLYPALTDAVVNRQTGRVIPYLDETNYYKLQQILRNSSLPKMYNKNLLDLSFSTEKKGADLLLASNIFAWLNMTPQKYDGFLSTLPIGIIEANYCWHENKFLRREFEELGFQIDLVPSDVPDENEKNMVITKISH